MSDAAEHARIRALRQPKPLVDPWRPLDVLVEEERGVDGRLRPSMTVFLAGSECVFTCVFCDLWRYTLDGPTPPGAIASQLEAALKSQQPGFCPASIKLYNASNFFDTNAIPAQDLETIASQLGGFRRVVVECHPRLVGESCLRFADRLEGRLEVAMGLETVHPEALSRLNKQMSLDDFARAAELLQRNSIDVRAFVLLSPPFVAVDESVGWTVRTVEYAFDRGVQYVSVIPMRAGNGEMERLARLGLFEPPTLEMLEEALMLAVSLEKGVVLADLWDVESLSACPACGESRVGHLRDMNRTGTLGEMTRCAACGPGEGDRS